MWVVDNLNKLKLDFEEWQIKNDSKFFAEIKNQIERVNLDLNLLSQSEVNEALLSNKRAIRARRLRAIEEGSSSMFTIKLYQDCGRQRILSAESFTILGGGNGPNGGEAEITLHQKNGNDDCRYDIKPDLPLPADYVGPQIYQRAIIENAAGKTTEIIGFSPK